MRTDICRYRLCTIIRRHLSFLFCAIGLRGKFKRRSGEIRHELLSPRTHRSASGSAESHQGQELSSKGSLLLCSCCGTIVYYLVDVLYSSPVVCCFARSCWASHRRHRDCCRCSISMKRQVSRNHVVTEKPLIYFTTSVSFAFCFPRRSQSMARRVSLSPLLLPLHHRPHSNTLRASGFN